MQKTQASIVQMHIQLPDYFFLIGRKFLEWNVINLVLEGVFKVFIAALCCKLMNYFFPTTKHV